MYTQRSIAIPSTWVHGSDIERVTLQLSHTRQINTTKLSNFEQIRINVFLIYRCYTVCVYTCCSVGSKDVCNGCMLWYCSNQDLTIPQKYNSGFKYCYFNHKTVKKSIITKENNLLNIFTRCRAYTLDIFTYVSLITVFFHYV